MQNLSVCLLNSYFKLITKYNKQLKLYYKYVR